MIGNEKAVFLDRDGTIIEDVGYLSSPQGVRLLTGTVEGLRRMREMSFKLVVITNQSGIARGYFSVSDYESVHSRLFDILGEEGIELDGAYFCPHHPEGKVAPFGIVCDCRKPKPGMLEQAAADLNLDLGASCMIGNSDADIGAGKAAGCSTILIGYESAVLEPDYKANDLIQAAALIARR